jgi:hypothetical protein
MNRVEGTARGNETKAGETVLVGTVMGAGEVQIACSYMDAGARALPVDWLRLRTTGVRTHYCAAEVLCLEPGAFKVLPRVGDCMRVANIPSSWPSG